MRIATMKNTLATLSLLVLLMPALALADDESKEAPPLKMPDVLTPSGAKFVVHCSDKAFDAVAEPATRHLVCEQLLANWRLEVARPTSKQKLMDSDSRNRDNRKPAFLSLRSVPRFPPSR